MFNWYPKQYTMISKLRLNIPCCPQNGKYPARNEFMAKTILNRRSTCMRWASSFPRARGNPPIPFSLGRQEGEIVREIEENVKLIDEMVNEVTEEIFVDAAALYVLGEMDTKVTGLQAMVEKAVTPRLSQFNDVFLQVLDSFILDVQNTEEEKSSEKSDIAIILLAIKQETLKQLSQHLPPQMKAIEASLSKESPNERLQTLRGWISGDHGEPVDPSLLESTISQMLRDFEDAALSLRTGKEIRQFTNPVDGRNVEIDVVLLAKLTILRQEARLVLEESKEDVSTESLKFCEIANINSFEPSSSSTHFDNYTQLGSIPEGEASFIKDIIKVSSPLRRKALIESAFRWDQSLGRPVRPGAVLDCIQALKKELITDKNETYNNLDNLWQLSIKILLEISEEPKTA